MNEGDTHIRYLNRKEIDTDKWDQCIREASNGLIYARSFYLDAMSRNWSALVLNDYEAVMPLTWNRKFGISYLYQPAFTAQLGMFFKKKLNGNMLENFIRHTKLHFRFCEIHLNFANLTTEGHLRANYILYLNNIYSEIRNGYKKRLLENLREADSHQLSYMATTDYASAISQFKIQYGKRFRKVRDADYRQFENLCGQLFQRNMLFVREVKDISGESLNVSIFFTDEFRIYNIMSVSLPSGRNKKAHFFLLDNLIKEFAGQNRMLDFEGSEISGIAEFYRKFGSINQPYPSLYYNRLPLPIRFLK
jgi:hypothetical protein